MEAQRQALVFAAMSVCGATMGAVYDLLQAAGRLGGRRRALCAALDFVFGPLCAAALILTALRLRTPVQRGYVLAAAALGFAAYQQTIGRIVRYLAGKICAIVRKSGKVYKKCKIQAGICG